MIHLHSVPNEQACLNSCEYACLHLGPFLSLVLPDPDLTDSKGTAHSAVCTHLYGFDVFKIKVEHQDYKIAGKAVYDEAPS